MKKKYCKPTVKEVLIQFNANAQFMVCSPNGCSTDVGTGQFGDGGELSGDNSINLGPWVDGGELGGGEDAFAE